MDLLEMLNQKMFLGQEFLTWLWYLAEQEQPVDLGEGRSVMVYLGEFLQLGPAQGAEGSRVTVRGREVSLAEAREGLRRGKLVEAIRVGLDLDEDEYWLTIKAPGLEVSSLKLPSVDQGEGPEARDDLLLERVFLIDSVLGALEGLFGIFLQGRLADQGGGELWRDLRRWSQGG